MNKTQVELLTKIGETYKLRIKLSDTNKEIDVLADELLNELKKIDGWECLFQHCKEHFEQYPDEFFSWCYVTYDCNSVSFNKSYSNGDDFTVLTINLSEDLSKQVERIKKLLDMESINELKKIEERERAELKRLKEKYGE